MRVPLIFIPGCMGSELYFGNNLIWPDGKDLLTRPEILRYPDDPGEQLEARDVVKRVVIVPPLVKQDQYNRLLEVLQLKLGFKLGKDLFTFPYDWRQDIRQSAQQLADRISQLQAQIGLDTQFQLLAHSMGGIVSRYYINCLGGDAHVGHLVVMGTPNNGVPESFRVLVTGAAVPVVKIRLKAFRKIVLTFPSLYQVLPNYPFVYRPDGSAMDIYDENDWLEPEFHDALANGLAFQQELGAGCKVPMSCLVGHSQKTLVEAKVAGVPPWKFDYVARDEGDSTVPEVSAFVKGPNVNQPPAFTSQPHGMLYDHRDAHRWLRYQLIQRYDEERRGVRRSPDQIPLSARGAALSLIIAPEIALPGQDVSLSLFAHREDVALTGLRIVGRWDNWDCGEITFAEAEIGRYTASIQAPIQKGNYALRVRITGLEIGELEAGGFLAVATFG